MCRPKITKQTGSEMKVKELIERLKNVNPELLVILSHFEGGDLPVANIIIRPYVGNCPNIKMGEMIACVEEGCSHDTESRHVTKINA
jgi:hypothetical protein